jgi:hypothetical protein
VGLVGARMRGNRTHHAMRGWPRINLVGSATRIPHMLLCWIEEIIGRSYSYAKCEGK